MLYIITRSSIINRCNSDGQLHYIITEQERPCDEAFLMNLLDTEGNECSRFMIQLETIEDIDRLGEKYGVDVMVTRNNSFSDYIALVLYDEEIDQELY